MGKFGHQSHNLSRKKGSGLKSPHPGPAIESAGQERAHAVKQQQMGPAGVLYEPPGRHANRCRSGQ